MDRHHSIHRQIPNTGGPWCASSAGSAYAVALDVSTCSCPDGRAPHDADGHKLCKHAFAALLY